MIITHETNDVGNVIRVITGIESEVMIRLHGCMVLDITPILGQLDQSKPVFLSLGKVDSEMQTVNMMQATQAKAPFMAPLVVVDNNIKDDKVKPTDATPVKSNNRIRVEPGKCKLCGGVDNLIKIDHDMSMCPSCAKINMGLTKINKLKNVMVSTPIVKKGNANAVKKRSAV